MTSSHDERLRDSLDNLKAEGRYRIFADLERIAGRFPRANYRNEKGEVREVTVWCSNDYLGMGQHEKVVSAMHSALDTCGAGAGGTRNISGTTHNHVLLEMELAELHGKESALLFTSGYVANQTTLATLGRHLKDCVILSDADNHASMIDGIRASGAEKHIFRHSDPEDLDRLLSQVPAGRSKLVAFESVYSMDGDIAPIAALCFVAERHGAMTFLDEVHAVGLYGPHGAGIAERDGVADRLDIIQGTLGKAFGCMGGYITGSATLCDFVRSHGSGFIFTTSLPPMLLAGALASVRHLRESSAERERHQERAQRLKDLLSTAGLPVAMTPSHIVPVMVGDPTACKQASDLLLRDHAIYVQPINYPTVPRGSERLRITPTPLHSDGDMDHLVRALDDVWSQLGLKDAA
ncbi:MAG: 5-aminolevulinate synthase [Pseudomonadota bacterium]